jgi:hypothetical protein
LSDLPAINGSRWRHFRTHTIAFFAGALFSTAVGGWLTYGVQTGLDRRVTALEGEERAEVLATTDVRHTSELADRLLAERIAALEGRIGTYVDNAQEMRGLDRHLSAVDGRQDGLDTRMKAVEDRQTGIISKVDELLAIAGHRRP